MQATTPEGTKIPLSEVEVKEEPLEAAPLQEEVEDVDVSRFQATPFPLRCPFCARKRSPKWLRLFEIWQEEEIERAKRRVRDAKRRQLQVVYQAEQKEVHTSSPCHLSLATPVARELV
jgi:hypothetical protein